jgi:hypothetical protein
MRRPQNMKSAKIFITLLSHREHLLPLQLAEAPRRRSGSKARAVMASSLPAADEMPWAAAR